MDLSDLALIFPTVERTLLGELLAFNGGDIERTAAAILDVGFPSDLDEPNDSSMAAQEALDAALARQTQQQFDEEFIAAQEGAAQEGAANATMPSPSGRQDPVSTSGSAAAKGKRMNLKLVALKRKSKGAKKEGQRDSLLPQGPIPLATALSLHPLSHSRFVCLRLHRTERPERRARQPSGRRRQLPLSAGINTQRTHQSRLSPTLRIVREIPPTPLWPHTPDSFGSHTAALLCSSPGSLAPPLRGGGAAAAAAVDQLAQQRVEHHRGAVLGPPQPRARGEPRLADRAAQHGASELK